MPRKKKNLYCALKFLMFSSCLPQHCSSQNTQCAYRRQVSMCPPSPPPSSKVLLLLLLLVLLWCRGMKAGRSSSPAVCTRYPHAFLRHPLFLRAFSTRVRKTNENLRRGRGRKGKKNRTDGKKKNKTIGRAGRCEKTEANRGFLLSQRSISPPPPLP